MSRSSAMSTTTLPPFAPADADHESAEPPAASIDTCSSVEELHAAVAHLNARESIVTARLKTLVSSQQSSVERELSRLDLIRAHLGTQIVTARALSHNVLSGAASTAQRISSAVKRLDAEKERVKATLEVVEQVVELKACVLGLTGSMGAPQDWEMAAQYLHRASHIPREIITGEFAESIVPSAEVPDPPAVTLENAAESLCGLFLREFEKAARTADGEKVTRFFKLFPLIGRGDTGLEVYGRYVCEGVSGRARQRLAGQKKEDGFIYADALRLLFEHIAVIVDQHGALVDRHYGIGRMVKVAERLQVEVDMQGGIIIDTFTDERGIDRKLTEIKSYPFSFLVQSFMPAKPSSGIPRTGSPAPGGSGVAEDQADQDGVETKDIDMLMMEIEMMLSSWSAYCRFVALKVPADPSTPLLHPPSIILHSALSQRISARLITPFTIMTTFFMRRSVEKAFQIDETPTDLSLSLLRPVSTTSSAPFTTSAVEDVLFIVKKLLSRSLETSQRALATSCISTVGRVLGSDFIGMIQRKMRDESYPRSSTTGTLPPDDKVISFLVLINNIDTAAEYASRIVAGFVGAATTAHESGNRPLEDLFAFEGDAENVREALRSMEASFDAKVQELVVDAVGMLFNQCIKPRLRPVLADAFREVDYMPPETSSIQDGGGIDELSMDDDLVGARFEQGWTKLVGPLKRIMTDNTYTKLHAATASYFSRLLEKRIWACAGRINELGAVRLQRDVAAVVGVVVRDGKYGVRDQFARCTQICLVSSMEEDETEELYEEHAAGIEWRLSVDERRRAREMVVRK